MTQQTLVLFLIMAGGMQAKANELGLRVADGFEVTRFAGDELAHDIYSMAIDSHGRVVVSGPGYVKTLLDDDQDGTAERASVYARGPRTGAMGMYYDGPNLICSGDAGVLRYVDADNDGIADGRPQVWMKSAQGEHGTHGITKGPDGWFYVVCGNDAGVGEKHVKTDRSPIRNPESGCILRLSPDGGKSEVMAHGFRNPYDGDFNSAGHFFTYDSDGERDQHLPWYAPTRVFDVAPGMHHGWLLSGWKRSWNRPPYFFDNVQRMAETGRGSPTGVVAYRHTQFPKKFQDGLFIACWSMGRVYFCPLQVEGATYVSKPETVLETTGTVGFSPVDLAVGPHGDLYIAIGGRGTEGSVFRLSRKGDRVQDDDSSPSGDELSRVLRANQPLDSWSRAVWIPVAQQLGRGPFLDAAADGNRTIAERIRAIEILVELFGGITHQERLDIIDDEQAGVVARVVWALDRSNENDLTENLLAEFTNYRSPMVERAAWEALASYGKLSEQSDEANWPALLESADRRIRAAAHLADAKRRNAQAPSELGADSPPRKIVTAYWRLKHRGTLTREHFGHLAQTAVRTDDNALRLDCIRLCQIALTDINAAPAKPDVYAGYLPNGQAEIDEEIVAGARRLADIFPTGNADLDRELSRLLGMVRLADAALLSRVSAKFSSDLAVPEDVHYLIVLSLLEGARDVKTTKAIAACLCRLHHKLRKHKLYTSRNWPLRVGETVEQLCLKDPALLDAVIQDTQFGLAEHSFLMGPMSGATLHKASQLLVDRILNADEEERASTELIAAIGRLPKQQSFPLLRRLWVINLLRDAIVMQLAKYPTDEDRPKLIEGLGSVQPQVVLVAANSLARLRPSQGVDEWKAAANALRRACLDTEQAEVRSALQNLLRDWAETDMRVVEQKDQSLRDQYQPWFALVAERFPILASANQSAETASWRQRAAAVDWSKGDSEAGKLVFQKRACAGCHGHTSRIGPSLVEAGRRLSRTDLLLAIVDPHRDVSPTYQATVIETANGKVYRGVIVYESPDATLLQTSAETTIRIAGEEVLSNRRSRLSLMPTGLLDGATDKQVADLMAYLRSLSE